MTRGMLGALVPLTLSLAACTTLERRDTASFAVTERDEAGRHRLEIEGLAMHSALVVERIEQAIEGDVMAIKVVLVLTRPHLSGSFDFVVDVPDSVNSVVFGEQRVEIWHRGWSRRDTRWWSSPQLVHDAIVGYLELHGREPPTPADDYFKSELTSLVLLFDEWDSNESLKALTQLTSWYLGTAGDEILHCIVVRKGERIRPLLDEARTRHQSECLAQAGSSCLSAEDHAAVLLDLSQRIAGGERCEVPQ
jgi:hypothetical protein